MCALTQLLTLPPFLRPHDPQHFQSCLLWHLIDEIIRGRSERIIKEFHLGEWDTMPHDTRIHLRKVNSIVHETFESSSGGVKAKQIERLKQSFEAFGYPGEGWNEFEGQIRPYRPYFGH